MQNDSTKFWSMSCLHLGHVGDGHFENNTQDIHLLNQHLLEWPESLYFNKLQGNSNVQLSS